MGSLLFHGITIVKIVIKKRSSCGSDLNQAQGLKHPPQQFTDIFIHSLHNGLKNRCHLQVKKHQESKLSASEEAKTQASESNLSHT